MNIINRYSSPGKYDHAPYRTLCKIEKEDKIELYIQNSLDEENPNWQYINTFSKNIDIQNELDAYINK